MEKVTIYGNVRPGRGERLPRVDFTESPRCNSPPLEDLLLDRAVPAPNHTRRRRSRLLPNLRFLPAYEEQEQPPDDGIHIGSMRTPCRQSCHTSMFEGQEGNETSLAKINWRSCQQSAVAHPTSTSSTSKILSRKVAASKALPRPPNTKVLKPKPQKFQKQNLTSLSRLKHKKTLAGGRQIKTHLRCEHLHTGPVWGGGAQRDPQEQRPNDNLTKRKAFECRRIARKIDALCTASAGATTRKGGSEGGCEDVAGKSGRDNEGNEEGLSPPLARHSKLMTSGRQYKTHLSCQHPSEHRRSQARPATRVLGDDVGDRTSSNRQGQLASLCDGSSDDVDNDFGPQSRFTEMGDKRNKVVLKSNTKTPRRSSRNVYEEVDSRITGAGTGTLLGASSSYRARETSNAGLRQESPCNSCDCLRGRSSNNSRSDCQYCREDADSSPISRYKVSGEEGYSPTAHKDINTLGHHRHHTTLAEPCSVYCRRRGCSSSRACQNICHFCGTVLGKNGNQSIVSDDDGLHRGSCDLHHSCTLPARLQQGGHFTEATHNKKRTRCRTEFLEKRSLAGDQTEERTRRTGEKWCSGTGEDGHPQHTSVRGGGRPLPPFPGTHALRRGSRGRRSSVGPLNYCSGDESNNLTSKRTRLEDSNIVTNYKRTCPEICRSNKVKERFATVDPTRKSSSVGAGILKTTKSTTGNVCYGHVLQNTDINSRAGESSSHQLRDVLRASRGAGAGEDNPIHYSERLINKQSHSVRSIPRKENSRPSLPRVKRDPSHSLVLEDHL